MTLNGSHVLDLTVPDLIHEVLVTWPTHDEISYDSFEVRPTQEICLQFLSPIGIAAVFLDELSPKLLVCTARISQELSLEQL